MSVGLTAGVYANVAKNDASVPLVAATTIAEVLE